MKNITDFKEEDQTDGSLDKANKLNSRFSQEQAQHPLHTPVKQTLSMSHLWCFISLLENKSCCCFIVAFKGRCRCYSCLRDKRSNVCLGVEAAGETEGDQASVLVRFWSLRFCGIPSNWRDSCFSISVSKKKKLLGPPSYTSLASIHRHLDKTGSHCEYHVLLFFSHV